MYDKFTPFGPIHSTRVCRDRNTFRSLGYGFVNFVNRSDAEHAMDMLMFNLLMVRPMRITWADKNPALRISGVGNIFIQKLAKDIDSLALHNTFSHFGTILYCKVHQPLQIISGASCKEGQPKPHEDELQEPIPGIHHKPFFSYKTPKIIVQLYSCL